MGDVLRVGLLGRDGRMGRASAEWIRSTSDMELIAAIGRDDDWAPLAEAEVALELTVAGNGDVHARKLLEMGLRPVVGTSGVSVEQVSELDSLARRLGLGGVVVPNFSAVMALLNRFAAEAHTLLPQVTIAEAHHTNKYDSPSGTAADTASRLASNPAGVTSVRMAGVTALHELRLSGESDHLLLRHESIGLESFREGLLQSLRYAAHAKGISMGLDAVMGEACKLGSSV